MDSRRKNIRLPAPNYRDRRSYFVTTCCDHRRPLLLDPLVAHWVIQTLRRFSTRLGFAVHAYCAMPDHLHFLATGLRDKSDLLELVDSFKQHTGFRYAARKRRRLWQFKFYDHILRRADAIDKVASYIWMNPVRKGICADPLEYPLSGSFVLNWKGSASSAAGWVLPWIHTGKREKHAALKRGATPGAKP